jgi:TolA-binding protein
MEKLFDGLIIIIIVLSVSCGFLLYVVVDQQNQYNTSEAQISQYQNQIGQIQTQIFELEGQIAERENQIDELENQIENLQDQIYQKKLSDAREVEITKIESEFYKYGGMCVSVYHVYVTLQNFGTKNVDGLTVSVYDTAHVGLIEPGSTKTVETLGISERTSTNVARLKFADTIIDEVTFDVINP